MNASLKPVIEELESLFSKFNARFFAGELEKPVITVSPDSTKGAYGWCTGWKAWQNGTENGGFYEINLCAEYMNRPFEETCSTLIHEMVHLWNLQEGVQDTSRSGTYHRWFKTAAEAHGLIVEKIAKHDFSKTTLAPATLAFVGSFGKNNFPLVRPKVVGLKGPVQRSKVSGSMSAPVVEPSSGQLKKFMLSVGNVKFPLKNRSETNEKKTENRLGLLGWEEVGGCSSSGP